MGILDGRSKCKLESAKVWIDMGDKREQPTNELNSQQRNQLKATLLANSEGRLLLVGVGLALLYALWLGIRLAFYPDGSQELVGITTAGIIVGRAGGMAFGYSMGLGHSTVISISMIIETILVLIVYPLFVFSWRQLLVINWLKKIFGHITKAAEAHKGKVQRYGIIGLFVFVFLPFWMTGPVVGCVIGYLLGLRAWVNITAVLGGTYVAIFCWAFFLRQFLDRIASRSTHSATVVMAILVAIMIAGHLLYRIFHKDKDKA